MYPLQSHQAARSGPDATHIHPRRRSPVESEGTMRGATDAEWMRRPT